MQAGNSYSQPVLLDALNWLNKQPVNWKEHITDSNIAVQMYMKSQKRKETKKMSFKKEISQFLNTNDKASHFSEEAPGAILLKQKSPPLNEKPAQKEVFTSPPANEINTSSKELGSALFLEKKRSFRLDEKSQKALEKTQQELNIENEQEALRVLIQLGRKSLERLVI